MHPGGGGLFIATDARMNPPTPEQGWNENRAGLDMGIVRDIDKHSTPTAGVEDFRARHCYKLYRGGVISTPTTNTHARQI